MHTLQKTEAFGRIAMCRCWDGGQRSVFCKSTTSMCMHCGPNPLQLLKGPPRLISMAASLLIGADPADTCTNSRRKQESLLVAGPAGFCRVSGIRDPW